MVFFWQAVLDTKVVGFWIYRFHLQVSFHEELDTKVLGTMDFHEVSNFGFMVTGRLF